MLELKLILREMRQLAMASLDNLEEHAPTFVRHIRAYIATLERRR